MSINSVSGMPIDYSQWQGISSSTKSTVTTNINESESDKFVSTGETCTDGKDDGKIGFGSALWNTLKGVGKTVVNGVKGMFTNKEGKFSLGKTLLSLGTAALCIAVPAVGVAACVVGGTMGAIQVGKGIYNAATADTDAEAKEAWQNIGGGAFTVGMSIVGAKAGVKAMKTAAGNTAKGSALQALEESGTKLSAKTLGQYGKAFVQDGYRSGKYNFKQIQTSLEPTGEALKIKRLERKVSKMDGGLTEKEISMQNELNARKAFATDETNAALDKINQITDSVKHPINTTKSVLNSETASSILKAIRHPVKTIKNVPGNLSSGAQTVLNAIKSTDSTYAQLVQQYGYENVAEVLELFAGYTVSDEVI